jgi:hypothetical protein
MTALATALSVIIIVLPGPNGSDNTVAVPPAGPSASSPSATSGGGAGLGLDVGVGGPEVAHAGVDLADWKLTIPEANDKGHAASVAPTDASAGRWLTKDEQGLHMWAPVNGTTTPNSQHTRTELVSLHTWSAGKAGRHTLRARLMIQQAPSSRQDIVVGQIHGADTISSSAFLLIHYDAGGVRVQIKQALSPSHESKSYPLLAGVGLNSWFDYTITENGDNTVTVSLTHGADTKTANYPIPGVFQGQTVRFQAGDYQQAESSGGSADASSVGQGDGSRVTFAALNETHPSGTNQPAQ